MNKLTLFILVMAAFAQCKKDDSDPLPEIASIVGKWRVVAYGRIVGDSVITESISKEHSYVYEFRYDGVILNENGKVPCCLPLKYYLDGQEFVPKPLTPGDLDPICATTYCASCPEMKITRPMADSVRIETCDGVVTSFVRER